MLLLIDISLNLNLLKMGLSVLFVCFRFFLNCLFFARLFFLIVFVFLLEMWMAVSSIFLRADWLLYSMFAPNAASW